MLTRRRAERAGAVRPEAVRAGPGLVRLQVGAVAAQTGEQLAAVALAVHAYRAGGAAAVALVAVVQMSTAAALGPFTGLLGDRCRRERVVVAADLVRAAATAGAAAAVWLDAPFAAVCALAVALAVGGEFFHTAHTALYPLLAPSVPALTRSTARTSMLRSGCSLAAPAAAGGVLLVAPEAALLAGAALCFGTAAGVLRRVPRTDVVRRAPAFATTRQALAHGVRAAARDRGTRLVLCVLSAGSAVRGALGVLLVLVPVELLGWGSSSIGFVTSLVGLGGLLGATALAALAGRPGLARRLVAGLALAGVPLVAAGAAPAAPVVLAALVVLGSGLTTVSTSGTTLLLRAVRDDVLARVLGVLSSVRTAGAAVGAGLTPVLVAAVGLRETLCLTGLCLLLVLLATRRGLRRLDRTTRVPERGLALLRSADVFAPLPAVALERLAGLLDRSVVPAGTAVVTEGDEADCVFLVGEGELVVEAREAGGVVDRIGPGEVFGEMALLHDAPRNATVRAVSRCELHRLTREEFLAAVTGSPQSTLRTSDLVAARLANRSRVRGRADG